MNPCNCYYGENCTKTTVCANDAVVEDLEERIKELEEGSCRFNCRTMREAFVAGYARAVEYCQPQHYPERSKIIRAERDYKQWLKDKRVHD